MSTLTLAPLKIAPRGMDGLTRNTLRDKAGYSCSQSYKFCAKIPGVSSSYSSYSSPSTRFGEKEDIFDSESTRSSSPFSSSGIGSLGSNASNDADEAQLKMSRLKALTQDIPLEALLGNPVYSELHSLKGWDVLQKIAQLSFQKPDWFSKKLLSRSGKYQAIAPTFIRDYILDSRQEVLPEVHHLKSSDKDRYAQLFESTLRALIQTGFLTNVDGYGKQLSDQAPINLVKLTEFGIAASKKTEITQVCPLTESDTTLLLRTELERLQKLKDTHLKKLEQVERTFQKRKGEIKQTARDRSEESFDEEKATQTILNLHESLNDYPEGPPKEKLRLEIHEKLLHLELVKASKKSDEEMIQNIEEQLRRSKFNYRQWLTQINGDILRITEGLLKMEMLQTHQAIQKLHEENKLEQPNGFNLANQENEQTAILQLLLGHESNVDEHQKVELEADRILAEDTLAQKVEALRQQVKLQSGIAGQSSATDTSALELIKMKKGKPDETAEEKLKSAL
jgi:hypothetical protein